MKRFDPNLIIGGSSRGRRDLIIGGPNCPCHTRRPARDRRFEEIRIAMIEARQIDSGVIVDRDPGDEDVLPHRKKSCR